MNQKVYIINPLNESMKDDSKLQDFLTQIKKEFKMPDDMSPNKILSILKDELNFRERLIISVNDKLTKLNESFPMASLNTNLKIYDLENFHVYFNLPKPITLQDIKQINELKLHFLFNMNVHPNHSVISGSYFDVELRLNETKLQQIKRYI